MTLAFRWFESSYPSHDVRFVSTCTKGNEKTGDFERFLPFFRLCIFSKFHRSLLPFSMLCPYLDSRKGLFTTFRKQSILCLDPDRRKRMADSVKNPSLYKLFTDTFDSSSNCLDLNSRVTALGGVPFQVDCGIEIERWEN